MQRDRTPKRRTYNYVNAHAPPALLPHRLQQVGTHVIPRRQYARLGVGIWHVLQQTFISAMHASIAQLEELTQRGTGILTIISRCAAKETRAFLAGAFAAVTTIELAFCIVIFMITQPISNVARSSFATNVRAR